MVCSRMFSLFLTWLIPAYHTEQLLWSKQCIYIKNKDKKIKCGSCSQGARSEPERRKFHYSQKSWSFQVKVSGSSLHSHGPYYGIPHIVLCCSEYLSLLLNYKFFERKGESYSLITLTQRRHSINVSWWVSEQTVISKWPQMDFSGKHP